MIDLEKATLGEVIRRVILGMEIQGWIQATVFQQGVGAVPAVFGDNTWTVSKKTHQLAMSPLGHVIGWTDLGCLNTSQDVLKILDFVGYSNYDWSYSKEMHDKLHFLMDVEDAHNVEGDMKKIIKDSYCMWLFEESG